MTWRSSSWWAVLASALVTAVHAQPDRAADVLAAARNALGGSRLAAVKTLSVEAVVQRNLETVQLSSDTEILLELPHRYLRTDTGTGPMGGGFTSGFNGDAPVRAGGPGLSMSGGGMVIRIGPGGPGGGMAPPGEKPSPEEQARMDAASVHSARAELSRLMLGWFANVHPSLHGAFSYVGEAESPEGKADVLEVAGAEGFSARMFVDRESRLPLMVTYRGPRPRMITVAGPPGGGRAARVPPANAAAIPPASQEERPETIEYTLFFDDWRDVEGIKFPHTLRRASAGTTNEEWTIRKVRVNPKLDARRFQG